MHVVAGDVSPLKERRGRVYNIAARFGATVAPAKMAASLRKSYSAGRASRQNQVHSPSKLLFSPLLIHQILVVVIMLFPWLNNSKLCCWMLYDSLQMHLWNGHALHAIHMAPYAA